MKRPTTRKPINPSPQSERIVVLLTPELRNALDILARSDNRTNSDFMRQLLIKEIARHTRTQPSSPKPSVYPAVLSAVPVSSRPSLFPSSSHVSTEDDLVLSGSSGFTTDPTSTIEEDF